ncbi:amino acid ABC transporter substrate-binding protein, PAAT family [Tistlia consotensis]|uniref:Amino acid ABC transporter substrate-binding protein, PAAT family n=1 Tax=Tistlia consotensis USBA 355 TaxID=560819 RepID=A0A1Y6BPH0_9PROT|nr:ABC transporter substrate-binding protein [Tistlia consotensis]SMF22439.1 amino acid ABC transporter substrate-binding protein, PAAT family [Tistlia consotensis USBA 355]SNR45959.1 amino acid ABC transporter substrate-binding protein, PAAT family [Tistlia consotensis]
MKTLLSGIAALGLLAGVALAAAPQAQADDLQKIKDAGELRIAMSGAYPPFNFVNDKNEVVGFDPSIGEGIAERMGVKPVIVTTAWDGIIAGLLANKYDTIVGSMTITPKRQEVVDFVGPYYSAGRAVFVKGDSPIKSLKDLDGKTIGVTLGETHEKWAREHAGEHGDWSIHTYKGLPELMLELNSGRVDAIVVDNIPVLVAVKKSGADVRQIPTPGIEGGSVKVGIAIRKGNPELHAAMQKALDAMMADGTYEKIAMKWIGADIR